ncbi:hypothetical protein DSM19430T_29790 [Desulfovibrio psychrotolerans]|uniref:Uncharacterized protein n=2 Tax=Desulfovibrio psychrotolerans TaxID=415242 RepID=A0A7J0BYM9_9BACT|nr:hypothetical protein DSM19430T_29790 [Desulfovibrio psychrotolerans]
MGKNTLQAWEMMLEAKDCLGMSALERIFKIGHKQIYKTMRNPDYDGDTARPFIQRVRMLLHDLNEAGGEELARAMLNYMAEPLEMHCIPNATGTPDKPDVMAECLDDYPALTKLHTAIQDRADMREVQALAEDVKGEVDETVVAYRQEMEG